MRTDQPYYICQLYLVAVKKDKTNLQVFRAVLFCEPKFPILLWGVMERNMCYCGDSTVYNGAVHGGELKLQNLLWYVLFGN